MSYNIQWGKFMSNIISKFSDYFTEKRFPDVTLVSDDGIPFQAHKFVLSIFSPVLKNLLSSNPHSHPLIYLSGVKSEELSSILQFIYHGKVSINPKMLKKIAQAAEDLKIKQLIGITLANKIKPDDDKKETSANCEDKGDKENENDRRKFSSDSSDDNETDDDIFTWYNVKDEPEFDNGGEGFESLGEEIINLNILSSDEQGGCNLIYNCKQCGTEYKSRSGLYYHISSHHVDSSYSCQNCKFVTTEKGNLKRHQQAVHEGKKYSCDKCEYQATSQGSLKRHRQAKHEGVTYSCKDCNYKAAFKAGLVQHIRVKHEGIRYTCDRCDYNATQSGNLKAHKESVHEGVKYSCDECEHKATQKSHLKKHKISFHSKTNLN